MSTRTTRPSRSAARSRRARGAPAPRRAPSADTNPSGEQRTRQAGGPQDHAFYACACGHAFEGDVSTHVACPKCGGDQTW